MACGGDRKALPVEKMVDLIIQKDPSDSVVAEINAGFELDQQKPVSTQLLLKVLSTPV